MKDKMKTNIKDTLIILASASPRRKELLKQIGLDFIIYPSKCEEKIKSSKPKEVVVDLAKQKALDVYNRFIEKSLEDDILEKSKNFKKLIILGADTIVVYKDDIFGKPKDEEEARFMLNEFSNSYNDVYTGVCLICCTTKDGIYKLEDMKSFYEKTQVHFCALEKEDIDEYIKTGEPMDKAGAYGIQGFATRYINKINGDYNNVVGLPLSKLWYTIKKLDGDE